jgi:DNA-binding beta-propeller fold protein YncE
MRLSSFVLTIAATTGLLTQSSPSYRVTHTSVLGGDGSWEYVVPDPPSHRLYIARQNRVMVVDPDGGKLLGEVTEVQGAHGTAIAADTGHGFVTSSEDKSVVMFDLKTFKVLSRISAAEDANAILFDKPSNRIFTLNGDANSSTVIDPVSGKAIKNLPLGGKPEYGVSAGDGKVYANLTDKSEVVEIDAKTATVIRRWSTAPCKQPVSMAIDTAHHRLFRGCRSGVMAVSDYHLPGDRSISNAGPLISQKPRMGPLEPCTSMPMRSPHLNPCALINRSRTTRFFQDKEPPLIRVHGFTHALKTPRSRSTSGIQTATRSVPGYRWLAHPSKKFKNSQATSRSSCQRGIATCLPNTGSQWSSV